MLVIEVRSNLKRYHIAHSEQSQCKAYTLFPYIHPFSNPLLLLPLLQLVKIFDGSGHEEHGIPPIMQCLGLEANH